LRFSDTLDLAGRYRAAGVDIRAGSKDGDHSQHFVVSSALGWLLILPKQWYLEGTRTELLLGFVWLGALLLPLGYWGGLAASSPSRETPSRLLPAIGLLAIVLFAGFVLIPRLFGLAPSSLGAWLATGLGVAGGAVLAGKKRPSLTPMGSKPEEARSPHSGKPMITQRTALTKVA
jgi:hypothetical protein